jgi:hypothetical protein
MAFWKMIKEGNDHFEATHLQPKVEVCNRRYVFDARSSRRIPRNPSCSIRSAAARHMSLTRQSPGLRWRKSTPTNSSTRSLSDRVCPLPPFTAGSTVA